MPNVDVSGQTVNEYDATIHLANGTRVNSDGSEIQWPNWQPHYPPQIPGFSQNRNFIQQRLTNDTTDFDLPWKTPLSVTGKEPNVWDDTIHQEDGVRTFRDGTPLQYPNWQVG